jgi:signal transduction histidine kinase
VLARLPKDQETALFRIAQESLVNILRHSGSATAALRLWREGSELCLEVRDQGRGFDCAWKKADSNGPPPRMGVGIAGMRERMRQLGGTLEIASGPEGTTVQARLPIHQNDYETATNPAG